MEDLNILRDLFDEKIIQVVNLFVKYPSKQFYLTEISKLSKVNVSTTFRILNKLVAQGFIKTSVAGKVRLYQLHRNEKTNSLLKVLTNEDSNPVQDFIDRIKDSPRIKKIILESKGSHEAKILIVGDYISKERLARICKEIYDKSKFKIDFVEVSEEQFKGLKKFGSYELDKKIIWERTQKE